LPISVMPILTQFVITFGNRRSWRFRESSND
jgi:hypothetical protein